MTCGLVILVGQAGASSYRISLTVLEVEERELEDLFFLTVTNTVGSQVNTLIEALCKPHVILT